MEEEGKKKNVRTLPHESDNNRTLAPKQRIVQSNYATFGWMRKLKRTYLKTKTGSSSSARCQRAASREYMQPARTVVIGGCEWE